MENKTSRLAMEIADNIIDDFYDTGISVSFGATYYLTDIIQRSIDHYRDSQLEELKERGWTSITERIVEDYLRRKETHNNDLGEPIYNSKNNGN